MLPSDLLVARKYGNTIRPVFADLNEANLQIAEKLVETFKKFQGERKKKLWKAIEALEGLGHDYRYVRGLATLLERRCRFEIVSAIKPVVARKRVFNAAAKAGVPSTLEKKRSILEREAAELQITVKALEDSLYADLDEESILSVFLPLDVEVLVQRYNLSLAQTLLFRSSEVEFTASDNWQRIFRGIRWLGLIYTIQKWSGSYWVKVDGPISLFKLSTRYGTNLAKIIPHIIVADEWQIRAKVLRRRNDRQLLNLNLNTHQHGDYFESIKTGVEEKYDSFVEQDFARRFNILQSGWKLIREPNPLPVGRHVMIPDFLFEKAGMHVYLEIAGFWTPEYLQHKLRQLQLIEGVDMIVAADKSNACQQLERMGKRLKIIYYKDKVPLNPIVKHLNATENKLKKDQLQKIQDLEITFEGAVVTIKEIAKKLGVLETVVVEVLKERNIPGYRLLGDVFIRNDRLNTIEERLNQRTDESILNLEEATQLIAALGGVKPTMILKLLGYRLEWHGIDPGKAIVRRN